MPWRICYSFTMHDEGLIVTQLIPSCRVSLPRCEMVFRHHKRVVLALLLMELALLRWPVLEYSYGLYAVVALIYFGVTYWFVFGVRKWWLYQFAGIAYVGYLTLAMLAPQIFAPS